MNNYFLIVLFSISLISCKSSLNTKLEILDYLEDENNGLKKIKEVNGSKITVKFKPNFDCILEEKECNKNIYLFTVSFDKMENAKNLKEYSQMIQKYAFNSLELVEIQKINGETIIPIEYFYSKESENFGKIDFLYAFKIESLLTEEYIKFLVKDVGLGTGDNFFKFEMGNFKNLVN